MVEELLAGTGRVDITPPIGSCLVGYVYPPRISRGVRDPLYATSMVLEREGSRVALVSCDLIAIPKPWSDQAKRLIRDRNGIPEENVIIAATHIHTGPCTTSIFISEADQDYLSTIPESIAASVFEAQGRLGPVELSVGVGHEPSLSFNRRFAMTDGSVRTNPGIGNPNIISPLGPIDPQLTVLVIKNRDKEVIGSVLNYANHVDVIGGNLISSDYPGMVCRLFRKRFGEESNLVYLNGACGDLNHIDVNGAPNQGGVPQMEMMAKKLFKDLLGIMGRTKIESDPRLEGTLGEVDLPLRRITEDELGEAQNILRNRNAIDKEVVFAKEIMLLVAGRADHIKTVVQGIRVGGTVVIALPGEAFVQMGLEIRKRSPFASTAVVELANDYVGYLPTDQAFDEGGYEVTPARSSKVGKGSSRILVDKALELAIRLWEG